MAAMETSINAHWLTRATPQNFGFTTPNYPPWTQPPLTPTRYILARRHGEERYAKPLQLQDVPIVAVLHSRSPVNVPPRPSQVCTVHALTAALYSKVPYHHGAPHINGNDGILPNHAKTARPPATEHA